MVNVNVNEKRDLNKTVAIEGERCLCPNCNYEIISKNVTAAWGELVRDCDEKVVHKFNCYECQEKIEVTLEEKKVED